MVLQAFFLASIWGALPLALLAKSGPTDQMIIACLMAGMISGGAFTLSTVPRAGLVYIWTMALASAAALFLPSQATTQIEYRANLASYPLTPSSDKVRLIIRPDATRWAEITSRPVRPICSTVSRQSLRVG